MKQRLTENLIRGLKWEGKGQTIRDDKVAGLLVAVNKKSKSYKVQRDLWKGQRGRKTLVKTVRHTFASTDEISLDEARKKATAIIEQIKLGIDPNAPELPSEFDAKGWTVAEMFEEYERDMAARGCTQRSIDDLKYRVEFYLKEWKALPICDIKRSMARKEHIRITSEHGSRVANQALKDFRAAYNFALKVVDDPDDLPSNPVAAVSFNKERASNRVIMPDDLEDWYKKVVALQNPIRKHMHLLGLLSGLRPGTLVSIEKVWIKLDEATISIPTMKSGRSFDLPLSSQMIDVVKRLLEVSEVLYPASPWLFPTRSSTSREIKATQVWKEKTLPSETGHILRHTYRTIAQRVGINPTNARLLLDHKVPGIDGVYVHQSALFDTLLAEQEKMSCEIFKLIGLDSHGD